MPSIVEYETVVERMRQLRMRCQYYNSGAFGFDPDVPMHFIGWIGPDDPTIRPAALERARKIPPAYEVNLAHLATRAWQQLFAGPAWVMPKSNWAYELDFGSKAWLPGELRTAGIDPATLEGRTNSPAVEFLPDEADRFTPFIRALLENLLGSDFSIAFPDHPAVCTLHHHKQIWWVSDDDTVIRQLESLAKF